MSDDSETVTRKFMFTLSATEVKERHQQAVAAEMESQGLKSKISALNGDKRRVDKKRTDAARAATNREEQREVECTWHHEGLLAKLRRSDTNEVVEERALTDDERQTEIEGAGKRVTNGHNKPAKGKRGRPRKVRVESDEATA